MMVRSGDTGNHERAVRLTESDLDFVIKTAATGTADPWRLRTLLREDESFRAGMVSDDKVFARIVDDEEALVHVSPGLYFEVLFRQARRDLDQASHTVERVGSETVAVFDTQEIVDLLADERVLDYLAAMLASFTRIVSYTVPVRVKPGVWRRQRFNDMDIDSLTRMCQTVEDDARFGYYKRIADVCLFVAGAFPEHAQASRRFAMGGDGGAQPLRQRRGTEEYETEGRRFYKLAQEHPVSATLGLSEVFGLLRSNFTAAKKPLDFISRHYLRYRRSRLFGVEG